MEQLQKSQDLSRDAITGAPGFIIISPEQVFSARRINEKSDVFSGALAAAGLIVGRPLIRAAPLQPIETYRKRMLEDLAHVLGPITDSDVAGMVDPYWEACNKPSPLSGPSSATIENQMAGCRLEGKRQSFFISLIQDSLVYRPQDRPRAFELFRRLIQEMNNGEIKKMTKLTSEERTQADRMVRGAARAKEIFKSLYNAD